MKKALAILLALALTLSLAACGGGTSSSTPAADPAPAADSTPAADNTPEASADPVNLTFWYWADNTDQSNLIQQIVADFNASNDKNITVTAEEYPWDSGGFTDAVFNAIMGGGGPDMSTMKLAGGKTFAANGLFADMSSYIDAWSDKSQIGDNVWEIMQNATGDGKTSILPWTLEALYAYYRPSYFEKAGVEVPTTFDEFLDVIEKCTMDMDGDGKTEYGYGMRGAGGGHEHLGNFLYPYGATWDDLTTPEALEAYKAYLSIYQNGYTPETANSAAFAELTDGFRTGLTAIIIHHIGSYAQWVEQFGDDVGAFPVPGSEKGQWTCVGDTELTIYEQCENKEAAFEFYKYMTVGEGGTTWFKGTGKGLGTSNIQATEEFKSNPFQAVAAEALKNAGVMPPTDTLTEFINNVWAPTNQQALMGQITPEEALAEMNKALHG